MKPTIFRQLAVSLGLVCVAFSGHATRDPVSERVQRWQQLGMYSRLQRAGALHVSRTRRIPDRKFVTLIGNPSFSEAIHREIYLAAEETAALVLLASLETSMVPEGRFDEDLKRGSLTVYLDRGDLLRECGLPPGSPASGCNQSVGLGGGASSVIRLFVDPTLFACVDRRCSFLDHGIRQARELLRGQLIHELMHNHQQGSDLSCLPDSDYAAPPPDHPCLPDQWQANRSWPRVEDQNKACFDSFAREIYSFGLPYEGFSPDQIQTLCKRTA